MIISEKQIMQLMTQLKDHQELLGRINFHNPYREYLVRLYCEINDQQSEKLKEITNE